MSLYNRFSKHSHSFLSLLFKSEVNVSVTLCQKRKPLQKILRFNISQEGGAK